MAQLTISQQFRAARLLTVCLWLALPCLTACAKSGFIKSQTAAQAAQARAEPACELWLFGSQRSFSENGLAHDVPKDHQGITLVEAIPGDDSKVREGVCIKRAGAALRVPQPLHVAIGTGLPSYVARNKRFCREAGEKRKVEGLDGDFQYCAWNGFFHAARPVSFELVAASGQTVDELVQLARVFRNGELVYQWNAAGSDDAKTVLIPGESIVAAGGFFARALPPHLAEFDLRFTPAGVELDPAILDQTAIDDRLRNQERWRALGFAVLASAASELSPELRQSYACFAWQLSDLEAQVRSLVDGEVRAPSPVPGCAPLDLQLAAIPSFTSELKKLKAGAQASFDAALQRIDTELAKLPVPLQAELEKARQQLTDRIAAVARESKVPAAELEAKLGNVDALVESARQSLQRTKELARRLRADALKVAKDPEQQARLAESLARAFEAQPDLFEARHQNPTPLPEERVVSMQYGDAFQGFALSPWFGVPFRLREDPGASFEASVAIPMLDVIGARYQVGRSRLGDLRLAIGVSGFLDKDLRQPGDASAPDAEDDETKKVFNGAAHVAVGFGTLKVAAALVMNSKEHRQSFEESFNNRFRLIVGADLLKLITGRNVELF